MPVPLPARGQAQCPRSWRTLRGRRECRGVATFAAPLSSALSSEAPSLKHPRGRSSLALTELPDADGQVLFSKDAALCEDVLQKCLVEPVGRVGPAHVEGVFAHGFDEIPDLPLDFPNFLISIRGSGSGSLFTALLCVLGVMG